MNVAIMTHRTEALHEFAKGLGGDIDWYSEPEELLRQAPESSWNLVVVDALAPGFDVRGFLQNVLYANSLLHTSVITDMSETDFIEYSVGLGVLCAVPAVPGWEDGAKVMNLLCMFYDIG